jgi:UDP-N-acetylglucosamine--N-acetylmuramyl-(pentapeptide) pyrophosphoryl-undecaprenol N-acetylglucosamine transferase
MVLPLGKCIDVAKNRFIFAGGGTGGHLFPAIAIADELKKRIPGAEILFVGTKDKIEATVVPKSGYGFAPIWISGFHRKKIISNILLPLKVIVSVMQSLSIIRKYSPDVVIGTGGYVAGPVVYAGTLLGKPTIIQDQNSIPGITTRLLGGRVNEVHLTFETARKYLRRTDNIVMSGNPTRGKLETNDITEAAKYFGFDPAETKKTLLVFGGSLGAKSMNTGMLAVVGELMQNNIRVIWQTGKNDVEWIRKETSGYSSKIVCVREFIDRMDYAYALSTLVLCRAGATTIAELTRLGKPAIMIPYPHAAANHQVENAAALVECGAAQIILDHEIKEKLLRNLMQLIGDDSALAAMGKQSKTLGKPQAAAEIVDHIIALSKSA